MQKLSADIFRVGVIDRQIDLFEGMYAVPEGVTYNSYVIKDEKTAVIDSVDGAFGCEWLKNIETVLNGTKPDYLIVQHMEPDHSACVAEFVKRYPDAAVIGNRNTFVMMEEFFGKDIAPNRITVKDGEQLSLGKHTLKFVFAPMVHWPEVMVTYETETKTLFSADAFGRFGADDNAEWMDEARRYYIGIVGKYGVQVKGALKKISEYEIKAVAPLHGPCLTGKALNEAMRAYLLWSDYKPESDRGTLIAFTSVYGHTAAAARMLADELEKRGEQVKVLDLARDDWAVCVAQAFRFPKLVLATTTYNADVFPAAREFIDRLTERNYKNRTVAFIDNGTWSPVAAKIMRAKFEKCANIKFAETEVIIRSALNGQSIAKVKALADELITL